MNIVENSLHLRPHRLKIALLQPQIPPNTGNIGRSCVASGTELHLVRPLGFMLDDRNLRRSAMDFWPRLRLKLHDDTPSFLAAVGDEPMWIFTTSGNRGLWQTEFADGDWLVFGNETRGIIGTGLESRIGRTVRIPQSPDERCLNLSTAAGIALYEALRQLQYK